MSASAPDVRPAAARFLGCAFAAGDLIFETDAAGVIVHPIGAAALLDASRDADLGGRCLFDFFTGADRARAAAALTALKPGERRGPIVLTRGDRQAVALSVFVMPQFAPAISCSLRRVDEAVLGGALETLRPREAWDASAGELLKVAAEAQSPLNMDLVELDGFEASLAALPHAEADQRRRNVATVLNIRSAGGVGATEVAPDRYAVLATDNPAPEALSRELAELVGPEITPQATRLKLEGDAAGQNMRALRYALDRFIEDGGQAAKAGFQATLRQTLKDSERFKVIVANKAFNMAYQAVIDLSDGRLHHFEALARFEVDGSPADTIRMAEELEMTHQFDLVVAEMVYTQLKADREVSIAVNLSARSLIGEGFVDRFLAVCAEPSIRPRMLVELTESAGLGDLAAANALIQRIRQAGHHVCIDDFGAGQASLEYLLDLEVDVLKIDGRYIRDLAAEGRAGVVLRHLVALCRDLGLPTIAEFVETPATDRLLREWGVDYGQGWFYGKPQPDTRWVQRPDSAPVRRVGAVEQWG
jgi:EAL domain-containing protein (putative c-di-GMP-specific phosphodiesterase class I)